MADLTPEEFEARLAELLVDQPNSTWRFISFVTEEGFAGAVFMRAPDAPRALLYAHRLGLNPGGEANCAPLEPFMTVKPEWTGRLLDLTTARGAMQDLDQQYRDHHAVRH